MTLWLVSPMADTEWQIYCNSCYHYTLLWGNTMLTRPWLPVKQSNGGDISRWPTSSISAHRPVPWVISLTYRHSFAPPFSPHLPFPKVFFTVWSPYTVLHRRRSPKQLHTVSISVLRFHVAVFSWIWITNFSFKIYLLIVVLLLKLSPIDKTLTLYPSRNSTRGISSPQISRTSPNFPRFITTL